MTAITLEELKKRPKKPPTETVAIDHVGEFIIRRLDLAEYFTLLNELEPLTLAEQMGWIVKQCCDVFGDTDPATILAPGELMQLASECQRVNGMQAGIERATVKN